MGCVLILGASSALARAVAVQFASRGHNLILAGRDQEELCLLAADLRIRYRVDTHTQAFDVLEFESMESVLGNCLSAAGDRLNGAVLCIGYMSDQLIAQNTPYEAWRILETNFTGCALALNILANYFEKRRSGFICAVSSVAGDRGRQSNYLYGSAKAGLTAYMQGLRNRLARSNVRVITVKPGFVDTRLTYGLSKLFLVASPDAVAGGIYKAVSHGKDVVYLPWFWRYIMLVIRAIPEGMFKKLRT